MHAIEPHLIGGALLLVLSVIASKASGKLGVPALVVFVGIGMLAGSEGIGGIAFSDISLAQTLGVIALIFILFSGGLETAWKEIRPIVLSGVSLATLGVLATSVLMGWFISQLLNFTFLEGMLFGAIVGSTDAAAVFSVLRSSGVNLKGRLQPLLELESGSNDSMAVFMTTGLVQVLSRPDNSLVGLVPMFFQQMLIGSALGFGAGRGISILINKIKLEYEGLYPVLTVGLVVLTYGITQVAGGNGFLAVYIAGIMLGKENFLHKKSLILFHDGLAWLMQITMFLALGLLVFPSKLPQIAVSGMFLAAFLILVARPISTYLSLLTSRFNFKEKALISWVSLRGAVPIILATYPLLAGLPKADTIFNLVFFVVLTSVLIQGTTIPFMARLLGVDAPQKKQFRYPIEYAPTTNLKSDLVELDVPTDSVVVGRAVVELGLPENALIVLLRRDEDVLVPRGSTRIEANDSLLMLADKTALTRVRQIISVRGLLESGGPEERKA